MSGYDNLISQIGKSPIFCSNLGFGEQGAVLNQLNKAIVVCSDIKKARKLKVFKKNDFKRKQSFY